MLSSKELNQLMMAIASLPAYKVNGNPYVPMEAVGKLIGTFCERRVIFSYIGNEVSWKFDDEELPCCT